VWAMDRIGGFTDVTDTTPPARRRMALASNRSESCAFRADISTLGQAGANADPWHYRGGDYRPR